MSYGKKIKEARKSAGLTQQQLADRLGVSFVNISQYENDKRNPKYETLKKIANALGISIYELLDMQDANTDEFTRELLSPDNSFIDRVELVLNDLSHQIKHYEKIGDTEKVTELKEYASLLSTQKKRIEAYRDLIVLQGSVDDAFRTVAIREITFYISKLNNSGVEEATKRVEELTRLDEFKRNAEASTSSLTIDHLLQIDSTDKKSGGA